MQHNVMMTCTTRTQDSVRIYPMAGTNQVYQRLGRANPFIRYGLPLITLTILGSFGLSYRQRDRKDVVNEFREKVDIGMHEYKPVSKFGAGPLSSMKALYSVWALAPTAHPGLQSAAQHLRKIHGGPPFALHVTVLGDIALPLDEAIARLRDLARLLKPITYRVHGVGAGNTYYQCVFLTMDPTPQVVDANAKARKAFGLESDKSTYFPHLSLLYGDANRDDRNAAKALAQEKFGDILVNSEFVVSSLSLWATDTNDKLLTTWRKVAECPMGDSSCSSNISSSK